MTDRGALVDILVGVARFRQEELQREGNPVPQQVRVRADIDTGSGITVISSAVFRRLDLVPVGRVQFFTPSTGHTPHEGEQFDVRGCSKCAHSFSATAG